MDEWALSLLLLLLLWKRHMEQEIQTPIAHIV